MGRAGGRTGFVVKVQADKWWGRRIGAKRQGEKAKKNSKNNNNDNDHDVNCLNQLTSIGIGRYLTLNLTKKLHYINDEITRPRCKLWWAATWRSKCSLSIIQHVVCSLDIELCFLMLILLIFGGGVIFWSIVVTGRWTLRESAGLASALPMEDSGLWRDAG